MLRQFSTLLAFIAVTFSVHAQQLSCSTSAVPAVIRSEGITERVGDILLNCSGLPGGTAVSAALTLFSTTVITNRINSSGNTDVQVVLETPGSSQILNTTASLGSSSSVNISGINFTVPSSGAATLRITNLRVNAWQAAEQPIRIQLASTGTSAIRIDNNQLTVGLPSRGLLASYGTTFVSNTSLGPDTITFSNLINKGTRFASIRLTEGANLASSFEKRTAGTDSGTRIAVRYSGFPVGARIYVPDYIAGSTATTPTAGGDLGLPVNGGSYGAAGQLLLGLVRGTDVNGGGGNVTVPAARVSTFDGASEVPLTNGSGIAVFEVLDSNNSIRESAQFPTFLVYTSTNGGGSSVFGHVDVSFGPISTDSVASTTAPVPRFQLVAPGPDCQSLGDCNSGIFPILSVNADSLNISAFTSSAPQSRFVRINNLGGSLLNWTASITYQNGSGWLTIDPASGLNDATIRVDFIPGKLPAGIYNATLTIDAGPIAGSKSAPLRLEITDFTPPPPPFPVVTSVVNAASFAEGPLVSGSLATIFGTNFGGTPATVMFDDQAATVFFANATQLNLRVPDLGAKTSVQLVVSTSDGRKSPVRTVPVSAAAPGIFNPGVLNQDNTLNSALNPAPAGSVIQVYGTGLGTGNVTAKLGSETIASPRYAGPAPGFPGLQQVNLDIPATLNVTAADLSICVGAVCSPTVRVSIKPAQ